MQIEGYLTQAKLTQALANSASVELIGTEVKVGNTKKRWDCVVLIGKTKFAVEFDGQGHYQNPSTILSDQIKNSIAKQEGYRAIRIPYWVQLTPQTSSHYFGIDIGVSSLYPHGFIDDRALLPSAFCWEGLVRFQEEMDLLPVEVRVSVIDSLEAKLETMDDLLVVPRPLKYLFDS